MTHGSKCHRGHGTIGAGTSPGRIEKGTRMAGRMGGGSGLSRRGCGSGIFAGDGGCDDSGCGKPKNKFGISGGGGAGACNRVAVFCRVKNNGATTLKGSSNSMPSWMDTGGGVGVINGRKFRQV